MYAYSGALLSSWPLSPVPVGIALQMAVPELICIAFP